LALVLTDDKQLMNIKNWSLFIIILVVFLTASYLIFHGYRNAQIAYQQTSVAMKNSQLKQQLLTTMYNASVERSVTLLKMHTETDPFKLDEMNMHMGEQARIFLEARKKLFTLPLTSKEKEILEDQRAAAMKNAPLQDSVATLFLEEKRDAATKVLIEQAIPGQHIMRKHITRTIDEYEKESTQIIDNIKKNFEEHNRISLLLGALIALTSIAIIIVVLTRLTRQEEQKLKAALKQAEQANYAKSEFLSRMSHELRTPLNAIIAFSDLILYEKALDPKLKSHIQHINKAGDHLLSLIDDILDLARIESGKLKIPVKPTNLQKVLEECESLIIPIAQDARVNLSFDPHVDYIVSADHTSLKQALLNLLSNAVKYNRKKGAIRVSYEVKSKNRLRINVIDTGKGLSSEQQQKLFKPFERLGAEFSEVKGTGIGLTITRDLIQLMGGSVGAESKKGKGSNFWIELALSDDQVRAQPVTEQVSESDSTTGLNIVYVEDDEVNAHLMSEIIKRMTSHKLDIARTGAEGLKLIQQQQPDIVLLDISLPDMDGYEVLRQMRAKPQMKKIPTIAVTANAMTDDVKRGEIAGFNNYMIKPVRAPELLNSIDKATRKD
jgi:signal transduction histidine kinase/ActR/RegA family two-component response regulator